MTDLAERTRAYFAALAGGATGYALAEFYHPDVVQEEFPNRLMPNGAKRNLREILDAAVRGQKVMTSQRFDIQTLVADGQRVAVEFVWSGTLAVAVGSLAAGDVMRGRFASFLEFRDGTIIAQRSYDCFDPW